MPADGEALSSAMVWATFAGICVLLVLSGFFSGSETALTAASRARIHRMAQDGVKRAKAVNRLIENPERLLGAILLGNNLVNILASSLATSLIIVWFPGSGVAIATVVMTAAIVIFSEILPKTYAITHSDRMAMVVAPLIRLVVVVFAPIVGTVQRIVWFTLKLFGVSSEQGSDVLSPHEELRGAIDLHHSEGAVVKRDRDMLGGILDLRELVVDDVMVHRKNMVMIDAGQPNEIIIDQVLGSSFTRIPLWKDDPENIIGVLHAKDLLRALANVRWDTEALKIEELAQAPWFVPETTSLQDQLNAFLSKRSHFALVVDEYGALMGLVTLEDILEEIVGDIVDEFDNVRGGIRPQPDGTVNIDGSVPIRDVNRLLNWRLPDEEATTIAGLVIHESKTIPDPGQIFTYYGYKFEVLRRQRNQITALRVTPPAGRRRKSVAAASGSAASTGVASGSGGAGSGGAAAAGSESNAP